MKPNCTALFQPTLMLTLSCPCFEMQTEKTVLGGVCKSLEPFIGAVYLAYYDEANRKHSNASLARSLKDLSLNVNSTYASVETLVS